MKLGGADELTSLIIKTFCAGCSVAKMHVVQDVNFWTFSVINFA